MQFLHSRSRTMVSNFCVRTVLKSVAHPRHRKVEKSLLAGGVNDAMVTAVHAAGGVTQMEGEETVHIWLMRRGSGHAEEDDTPSS